VLLDDGTKAKNVAVGINIREWTPDGCTTPLLRPATAIYSCGNCCVGEGFEAPVAFGGSTLLGDPQGCHGN
jgi:hypothetical protein